MVLGGILSGVFSPTEASAFGVWYVAVPAFVDRKVQWKKLRGALLQSVETAGSILLIVAAAGLFGWVLAREQAPQLVASLILHITDRPVVFLILVNISLLIVGALFEPTSAILILAPVLVPVADTFGLSPVHFGTMMIFNLMIGLLTPPVGLVLFVLSSVTKHPVTRVVKGILPFLIPMLATLALIVLVPAVSLWLPSLIGIG